MSTTTTRRRTPKTAPALHIPLSVLASIPERLRVLAETLKICAQATNAEHKEFRAKHEPVRKAYNDANGSANNAVNSFAALALHVKFKSEKDAMEAAQEAQALTSAIYKASGNIHNDDAFKSTFGDAATTQATLTALADCADRIRAAVSPFGYN